MTEHLRMITLVFICEFWEVFKNTFFIKHLWGTTYFVFIFSESIRRGFKSVRTQFLSTESSITCNWQVQSWLNFPMLNLAFDVFLSTAFVKQLEILRFLQFKYQNVILLFALCFDTFFLYKNQIFFHHGNNNFLFWIYARTLQE